MIRRSVLAIAFFLGILARHPAGAAECAGALSARDVQEIRAVIENYRTAWLRGDAKGVLALFTSDAVLLPAHGAPWIVGTAAITGYWWPPDAPATTITKLDVSVEAVEGNCGVASIYGKDDVEWTQIEGGAKRAHGHPGTYLNVMRKSADGSWRISRHMWDDGASR